MRPHAIAITLHPGAKAVDMCSGTVLFCAQTAIALRKLGALTSAPFPVFEGVLYG